MNKRVNATEIMKLEGQIKHLTQERDKFKKCFEDTEKYRLLAIEDRDSLKQEVELWKSIARDKIIHLAGVACNEEERCSLACWEKEGMGSPECLQLHKEAVDG